MPSLPPNFWNEEYRKLLAVLAPKLADAAKRGARGAGSQLGLGANYQLSDADATQWAQTYTDKLLQQLGTTTEALVGAELEKYFSTPGTTMGDLVEALAPKLAGNVARANAIAVTEVTRAYAAGQRAAYTRNGVKRWVWRCSNDELTCPYCSPLNGKIVEIGQPFAVDKKGRAITEPPYHVNCRCWMVAHIDVPGKMETPSSDLNIQAPQAVVIQPSPVPVQPPAPPPPPVLQALDHDKLKQVDLHVVEPTWQVPVGAKKLRYGGVIFDDQGRVLMRKPTGNFDGYAWTFPKGGGEAGEHPVEVALREVAQESGHKGKIVGLVPGGYESGASRNYFFVMRSDSYNPNRMDTETEEVVWATPEEAKKLIAQTTNAGGRERDLKILDAAVKANTDLAAGNVDQSHLFAVNKPPEPVKPPEPIPAPVATPEPPSKPKTKPKGFPASVDTLTPVRSLGGSTGAQLMRDASGREFVVKRGASADHLREESAADELYQAMGISVPKHQVYDTPSGPVKVSEYLPNTKTLKQVLAGGDKAEIRRVRQQLQKGFGADALLGNWDVVGLEADNILVDEKGKVWRIDNGGALRFRAQGTPKPQFGAEPVEVWTMRGKAGIKNDQTEAVFGDLKYNKVVEQMRGLVDQRADILDAASPDIRPILSQRLDQMEHLVQTADHMTTADWESDYQDRFGMEVTWIKQRGIVDKLPDRLTTQPKGHQSSDPRKPHFDVELHDANGKPFDDLRGNKSPYAGLHETIRKTGGRSDLLENWMREQAGDSWNELPEAYKYYLAKQGKNKPADFWWKYGEAHAKNAYQNVIQRYGGEDAFKRTFDAYHAFTYELLQNTELPNVDRNRGVATVLRTEDTAGMGGAPAGARGWTQAMRGAAESASLLNPFYYKGDQLLSQEVPLTDILGTYLTERTPGGGHGAFAGDSENEFVVMLGRIPFDHIASGRP